MMLIDPQLSKQNFRPFLAAVMRNAGNAKTRRRAPAGQRLSDKGKKSGAAVPQREFGPVFCAEFAQHVFDVNFYGAGLEPQLFGNLLVG